MPRLNECQIIARYPFGIPTLRGFPPPPPRSARVPLASLAISNRRTPSIALALPPVRSPSYRRLHDCLFIPNIEQLIELAEARRVINGREQNLFAPAKSNVELGFTSPLAIGMALTFLPPLAVSLVWSSRHFNHAAKVAITVYGMFTFVMSLIAVYVAVFR